MIDLIKKLKRPDTHVSFDEGYNKAIDNVIQLFNQHNIINAPKTIKLSEIVSRLEKIMLGCNSKIHIERFGKHILIFEKTIRSLTLIAEFNLNNKNIKGVNTIVSIKEEYFLSSLKWLYTLWIAGTTIEDDLKEEE